MAVRRPLRRVVTHFVTHDAPTSEASASVSAAPGSVPTLTAFITGDRVRLANDLRADGLDPVGTVLETVRYTFKDGSSVRDVLVRWDTGVEVPVAPDRLVRE